MKERHGGLWSKAAADDGAVSILDMYDAKRDCILVIAKRRDGRFQPWLYRKAEKDHQWSLPWWTPVNDKVILASEQEAAAFLEELKQNA